MNDKELADKVVAIGVGAFDLPFLGVKTYEINGERLATDVFVRDWRVAGQLIEKCRDNDISINIDGIHNQGYVEAFNLAGKKFPAKRIFDSIPRTINEVAVEALS